MIRQLACRSLGGAKAAAARQGFKKAQVPQMFLRSVHSSIPSRKEEEPLPPSIMEKYNLYDPTRWVPITVGSFGLATATGLYHWDAESQMLGLFVLFVGTIYSQGGDAIAKYFDDTSDAILKEHQALENAQIDAVKLALDAHKRQTAVYEDIKMIFEGQKVVMDSVVGAAQKKLKHQLRSSFVKQLDTVADAEASLEDFLQKTLVDNATASVTSQYQNDSGDLTSNALASALAAIKDPAASKDQVGDLYKAYFSNARSSWEAADGKEVDLDAEIVAAASEAMATIAKRDELDTESFPSKMVFRM